MFNIEAEKRTIDASEFNDFGIHIPKIMPDEYFSGYLERFTLLNGFENIQHAKKSIEEGVRRKYPDLQHFTLIWFFAKAFNIEMSQFTREHTLIPLGNSFLTNQTYQSEEEKVLRKFRRNTFAKNELSPCVCRKCAEEDLNYWGFSYWRRSHVIPGVEWCIKHDTLLENIAKNKGVQKTPSHFISNNYTKPIDGSEANKLIPFLHRYTQLTSDFFDLDFELDYRTTKGLIEKKLKANEPIYKNYYVSREILYAMNKGLPKAWVIKYHPNLLYRYQTNRKTDCTFINILTVGQQGKTLINYLILIALLFEDTDEALVEIKNEHLNQPLTEILTTSTVN